MLALNHITGAMDDIDTILQRHLKDYVQVPRTYSPYDSGHWTEFLKQIHRDFGRPGERWSWMVDHRWQRERMEDPDWRGIPENEWRVIFYFKDNADAVLFGLKY